MRRRPAPHRVDVRIVAATNRQPRRGGARRQVSPGSVLSVDGGDDRPAAAARAAAMTRCRWRSSFWSSSSRDAGRGAGPREPPSAAAVCRNTTGPATLRELRNLMERVAFLSPNEKVEASDLVFIPAADRGSGRTPSPTWTLKDATEAFEEKHIRGAIERAGQQHDRGGVAAGVQAHQSCTRKMRMLEQEFP